MAEQKAKELRRDLQATLHSYPEIKQKTKDATNSDPWGPTDTQKQELAQAARGSADRALILKALWKRVDDHGTAWPHVYKALDVLEHLLLCEVPGIAQDLRVHDQMLAQLLHYCRAKERDSEETDKCNGKVRAKAKRLLGLMGDDELLASERVKLRRIQARIEGGDYRSAPTADVTPAASATPGQRRTVGGGVGVGVEAGPQRGLGPTPGRTSVGGSTAPSPDRFGSYEDLDADVHATHVVVLAEPALVEMVLEMGITTDRSAVRTALIAADNNPDRAVAYLLSGEVRGVSGSVIVPRGAALGATAAAAGPTQPATASSRIGAGVPAALAHAPGGAPPTKPVATPLAPPTAAPPAATATRNALADLFAPSAPAPAPAAGIAGLWDAPAPTAPTAPAPGLWDAPAPTQSQRAPQPQAAAAPLFAPAPHQPAAPLFAPHATPAPAPAPPAGASSGFDPFAQFEAPKPAAPKATPATFNFFDAPGSSSKTAASSAASPAVASVGWSAPTAAPTGASPTASPPPPPSSGRPEDRIFAEFAGLGSRSPAPQGGGAAAGDSLEVIMRRRSGA